MSAAGNDEALRDEAAAWVLRLGDPSASARDHARFDRWQAKDPRHAAFFRELADTATLARQARAEMRTETQPVWSRERASGRRRVLPLGLAAAASLALAAWFGLSLLPETYETAIGETRSVRLADGSTVSLNAHTKLRVRFNDAERRLVLERGEALFDVAKDPARPFRVTAGDREVQAVGTVFDIDRQGTDTAVAVQEGIVALNPPDAGATPLQLRQGQAVRYATAGTPGPVQAIPPHEVGAWRQGLLHFRDVPFATVAASLGRYFPGSYRVADPALAETRVSIAFSLEGREATLKAIEQLFAVRAVKLADGGIEFVRAGRR